MLISAFQPANASFFFLVGRRQSSYIFSPDELLFDQKIRTETLAIWRPKLISCKRTTFFIWILLLQFRNIYRSTHTNAWWVHGMENLMLHRSSHMDGNDLTGHAIWHNLFFYDSDARLRRPPSPYLQRFSFESYNGVVSAWISIWFDHKSYAVTCSRSAISFSDFFELPIYAGVRWLLACGGHWCMVYVWSIAFLLPL